MTCIYGLKKKSLAFLLNLLVEKEPISYKFF